jgi:hypothetical protein
MELNQPYALSILHADQYNLQIRTAGDDRVRASHAAALNGITRPANDAYWNTTWTPFDWDCRCRIIQVLKGKYEVTDVESANKAAASAVGELFKYNPGKEQVIFPSKHPYYPQHCNGAKLNVSGLIGFAKWLLDAEGDRCMAMGILKRQLSRSAKWKNHIYDKPVDKQYKTVYESKTGAKVNVHQLVNDTKDVYAQNLYAAKAMARENINIKIQPVILEKDILVRKKLMPGYTNKTKNPDLLMANGIFIDVKSPAKHRNIISIAASASDEQEAEALITDKKIKISVNDIGHYANEIFTKTNYKFNVVHFVINGKYYAIHR